MWEINKINTQNHYYENLYHKLNIFRLYVEESRLHPVRTRKSDDFLYITLFRNIVHTSFSAVCKFEILLRKSFSGIVTSLRAGRFECQYRQDIFLYPKVRTGSGTHPASYSARTWFLSGEQSGWSMKLTTVLHTVPKLMTSRFIRLNTLYACMSWRDGHGFCVWHNLETATKSLTSLRILKDISKLRSRL